jgi:hypothetical protein
MRTGDAVQRQKPDIVAVCCVFRARIAQSDKQFHNTPHIPVPDVAQQRARVKSGPLTQHGHMVTVLSIQRKGEECM